VRSSPKNSKSLKTPPVSPVATSPIDGFVHGYHHNSGKRHPETPRPLFQTKLTATSIQRHPNSPSQIGINSRLRRWTLGNASPAIIAIRRIRKTDHHRFRTSGCSNPQGQRNAESSRRFMGIDCYLQTYRPPTPPLPSRKRTSAPPTPITTMNKPMQIVRDLVHIILSSR
jgi:hypothetical protein